MNYALNSWKASNLIIVVHVWTTYNLDVLEVDEILHGWDSLASKWAQEVVLFGVVGML